MDETAAFIPIPDQGHDTCAEAGAIVWWSLHGLVDVDDVRETLEGAGFDAEWVPSMPRTETIAQRALNASVTSKHQMVRQVGQSTSWEFMTEHVGQDESGEDQLVWTSNVKLTVQKEDGEVRVRIVPATESDADLGQVISTNMSMFRRVLTATDISVWLVWILQRKVQAVSLHQRGGFYFVPQYTLGIWKQVCEIIEEISGHKMRAMPAVASEDAVEAISDAVRREVELHFVKATEYLHAKVSTRGLNAYEKSVGEAREKLDAYTDLLGVSFEDLESRAQALLGTIAAARS